MRLGQLFRQKCEAACAPVEFDKKTFNKYPTRQVKPFKLPGNVLFGVGFVIMMTSFCTLQHFARIVPHAKGTFYGVKSMDVRDLVMAQVQREEED